MTFWHTRNILKIIFHTFIQTISLRCLLCHSKQSKYFIIKYLCRTHTLSYHDSFTNQNGTPINTTVLVVSNHTESWSLLWCQTNDPTYDYRKKVSFCSLVFIYIIYEVMIWKRDDGKKRRSYNKQDTRCETINTLTKTYTNMAIKLIIIIDITCSLSKQVSVYS